MDVKPDINETRYMLHDKFEYIRVPQFTIDNYMRVFIGVYTDESTAIPGQHDFFRGNSILIDVGDGKYMHVGMTITEYDFGERIHYFESPVTSNADVPYPVAVSRNNVYFLMDNLSLPFSVIEDVPESDLVGMEGYYDMFFTCLGDAPFVPIKSVYESTHDTSIYVTNDS
jgi:hypothetical protein